MNRVNIINSFNLRLIGHLIVSVFPGFNGMLTLQVEILMFDAGLAISSPPKGNIMSPGFV